MDGVSHLLCRVRGCHSTIGSSTCDSLVFCGSWRCLLETQQIKKCHVSCGRVGECQLVLHNDLFVELIFNEIVLHNLGVPSWGWSQAQQGQLSLSLPLCEVRCLGGSLSDRPIMSNCDLTPRSFFLVVPGFCTWFISQHYSSAIICSILNKAHFTHEPRAVTVELWEPKRKCPKAVPTHLQNHAVWSHVLKCNVKSYVTWPSTKYHFNDFPFIRILMHDKIE